MVDIAQILPTLLPKQWLDSFEVTDIKELTKEWQITLIEKAHLIPNSLQGKRAVLNGYFNPVEIEDFPLRGKPTYLKFYRRRWKEENSQESFGNQYDFHPNGMKATQEFGLFLKELDREKAD